MAGSDTIPRPAVATTTAENGGDRPASGLELNRLEVRCYLVSPRWLLAATLVSIAVIGSYEYVESTTTKKLIEPYVTLWAGAAVAFMALAIWILQGFITRYSAECYQHLLNTVDDTAHCNEAHAE